MYKRRSSTTNYRSSCGPLEMAVYLTIKLGQLFRCQREKIIVPNDVHSLVNGRGREREVITQQHTYTYLIIILLLFFVYVFPSPSLSLFLVPFLFLSPHRRRRLLPFLSLSLCFFSIDSFSFDETNVDLIGDSKSYDSPSTRVSDQQEKNSSPSPPSHCKRKRNSSPSSTMKTPSLSPSRMSFCLSVGMHVCVST